MACLESLLVLPCSGCLATDALLALAANQFSGLPYSSALWLLMSPWVFWILIQSLETWWGSIFQAIRAKSRILDLKLLKFGDKGCHSAIEHLYAQVSRLGSEGKEEGREEGKEGSPWAPAYNRLRLVLHFSHLNWNHWTKQAVSPFRLWSLQVSTVCWCTHERLCWAYVSQAVTLLSHHSEHLKWWW